MSLLFSVSQLFARKFEEHVIKCRQFGINSAEANILFLQIGHEPEQIVLSARVFDGKSALLERDPSQLPALIDSMQNETNAVYTRSLGKGNNDAYIQYFYNLLAMQALFSYLSGLAIITNGQANLSEIGKRTNAAPVRKCLTALAGLSGELVLSFAGSVITVLYLVFVLKKDMGVSIPVMLLITLVGSMAGISIGFFFGGIGNAGYDKKNGILTAIIMALCFLSGLMIGNMRAVIEVKAPWFNRINPAALITDCFYSANTYGIGSRFYTDILTLVCITAILTAGGMILTRRQRYASL